MWPSSLGVSGAARSINHKPWRSTAASALSSGDREKPRHGVVGVPRQGPNSCCSQGRRVHRCGQQHAASGFLEGRPAPCLHAPGQIDHGTAIGGDLEVGAECVNQPSRGGQPCVFPCGPVEDVELARIGHVGNPLLVRRHAVGDNLLPLRIRCNRHAVERAPLSEAHPEVAAAQKVEIGRERRAGLGA